MHMVVLSLSNSTKVLENREVPRQEQLYYPILLRLLSTIVLTIITRNEVFL
jgi:hypothetical protein